MSLKHRYEHAALEQVESLMHGSAPVHLNPSEPLSCSETVLELSRRDLRLATWVASVCVQAAAKGTKKTEPVAWRTVAAARAWARGVVPGQDALVVAHSIPSDASSTRGKLLRQAAFHLALAASAAESQPATAASAVFAAARYAEMAAQFCRCDLRAAIEEALQSYSGVRRNPAFLQTLRNFFWPSQASAPAPSSRFSAAVLANSDDPAVWDSDELGRVYLDAGSAFNEAKRIAQHMIAERPEYRKLEVNVIRNEDGSVAKKAIIRAGSRYRSNPSMSFGQCVSKMSKRPGVYSPAGLCAYMGRQKYGEQGFAKMSAAGRAAKKARRNPSIDSVIGALLESKRIGGFDAFPIPPAKALSDLRQMLLESENLSFSVTNGSESYRTDLSMHKRDGRDFVNDARQAWRSMATSYGASDVDWTIQLRKPLSPEVKERLRHWVRIGGNAYDSESFSPAGFVYATWSLTLRGQDAFEPSHWESRQYRQNPSRQKRSGRR